MKPWRALGLVLAFSFLASSARAETDVHDAEALAHLPNNTLVTLGYARHVSSSDSQSFTQNIANFRAVYVLKFGNVAFVPFDAFIPAADVSAYEGGGALTLHTSGLGDLTYLPTIAYIIPEGDSHTVLLFNPNFAFPTGNYDKTSLVNVGNRQWVVKPQVALGQRFLRAATLELVGNASFYTKNNDFVVPAPTATNPLATITTPMEQHPTIGGEVHLAVDLSTSFMVGASYYYTANGQKKLTALGDTALDQPTVQTLRFTWGVRLEQSSLLYVQYNQDIFASHDGSISRWFGVRFSHAFFQTPTEAQPAAPPPAVPSPSVLAPPPPAQ
ncbi:MAG TPA: transporter [Polyangiaceae bacterium]|nr:transporter [Polyangiaceae bacterium]